jgi:hypothetical protein
MKPVVLLPVLVGVVIAGDIADEIPKLMAQYPSCALECLIDGAMQHGCSAIDYQCQCTKAIEITKTVSPCFVHAGCRLNEIGIVADTISSICELVARNATGGNTTPPVDNSSSTIGNEGVSGAASRNLGAVWVGAAALAAVAAVVL